MRKILLLLVALLLLVSAGQVGCKVAPAGPPQPPKVELMRVEVASYFPPPWTGWPGNPPTPTPAPPPGIRVPLILGVIFNITNPNDYTVMLDQMKFTVEFEATPNEYFALNTPIAYEKQNIPAKATNQYRVTVVLDSAVVPGNLAVTSGARLSALQLSAAGLVKKWWEEIGDFKFSIKVSGGTADFKSSAGNVMATFEGRFPK